MPVFHTAISAGQTPPLPRYLNSALPKVDILMQTSLGLAPLLVAGSRALKGDTLFFPPVSWFNAVCIIDAQLWPGPSADAVNVERRYARRRRKANVGSLGFKLSPI